MMLEIPDINGTVRGYRSWTMHKGALEPVVTNIGAWKDGVNHATCPSISAHQVAGEKVPVWGCTCGFYATYSPWEIPGNVVRPFSRVTGIVECSGGIVLGDETGFRAQKARITALYLPRWRVLSRRRLKRTYPGVKLYSFKLRMLRQHRLAGSIAGTEIPRTVRRWPQWRWVLSTSGTFGLAIAICGILAGGLGGQMVLGFGAGMFLGFARATYAL
jgi:hypothetical protein